MSLDSLDMLLEEELQDIYDAEHQLTKALPKMAEAAQSKQLQQAFEQHLRQTEQHIKRLEQVFESLGKSPQRKPCKAMKGLVAEGDELIKEDGAEPVKDAALIAAAQKVEHYEIASYGTVRTWAELAGNSDVVDLLQKTLDEEAATDEKLTKLAGSINKKADKE